MILGEDDDDPHTTVVATKCQRAGAQVLIGLHFCDGRLGEISHPEGAGGASGFRLAACVQSFDVLWNRLKSSVQADTSEQDLFALRERRDFVMSAIACFIPFWSAASTIRGRRTSRGPKPYQLALAREVGLAIPKDHRHR